MRFAPCKVNVFEIILLNIRVERKESPCGVEHMCVTTPCSHCSVSYDSCSVPYGVFVCVCCWLDERDPPMTPCYNLSLGS